MLVLYPKQRHTGSRSHAILNLILWSQDMFCGVGLQEPDLWGCDSAPCTRTLRLQRVFLSMT